MSAKSFDADLYHDTDEALQNFLDAVEEANRRGPMELLDFFEELRRGE